MFLIWCESEEEVPYLLGDTYGCSAGSTIINFSEYLKMSALSRWLCCTMVVVLVYALTAKCEAHPLSHHHADSTIDLTEALRRMRQVPQSHCLRYRRVHLHGHCSRWWYHRRHLK